jgi:uncharacterized protein
MEELRFIWDVTKAENNLKKHGISFEEATTAFSDANALVHYDLEHSKQEDRFILIGFTETLRLIVVCHCYREEATIIRLISARRAGKPEQKKYLFQR